MINDVGHTVTSHDVFYVPQMMYNLMQTWVTRGKGFKTIFKDAYGDHESGMLDVYQKLSELVELLRTDITERMYQAVIGMIEIRGFTNLTRNRVDNTCHHHLRN